MNTLFNSIIDGTLQFTIYSILCFTIYFIIEFFHEKSDKDTRNILVKIKKMLLLPFCIVFIPLLLLSSCEIITVIELMINSKEQEIVKNKVDSARYYKDKDADKRFHLQRNAIKNNAIEKDIMGHLLKAAGELTASNLKSNVDVCEKSLYKEDRAEFLITRAKNTLPYYQTKEVVYNLVNSESINDQFSVNATLYFKLCNVADGQKLLSWLHEESTSQVYLLSVDITSPKQGQSPSKVPKTAPEKPNAFLTFLFGPPTPKPQLSTEALDYARSFDNSYSSIFVVKNKDGLISLKPRESRL